MLQTASDSVRHWLLLVSVSVALLHGTLVQKRASAATLHVSNSARVSSLTATAKCERAQGKGQAWPGCAGAPAKVPGSRFVERADLQQGCTRPRGLAQRGAVRLPRQQRQPGGAPAPRAALGARHAGALSGLQQLRAASMWHCEPAESLSRAALGARQAGALSNAPQQRVASPACTSDQRQVLAQPAQRWLQQAR